MANTFEEVQDVIRSRRSISPGKMNGGIIADSAIQELLSLADWAPTHGRTEPWHFFVHAGNALKAFGKAHADMYWQRTEEDKRLEAKREKLLHQVDKASHLVIVAMKRGDNGKIPVIEEVAAASAAIQNILLGATALGIASFWSTGGMTHAPALKEYLGLGKEDIVMGLIYLGYTEEPAKEGTRSIPISEKTTWITP